MIKMPTRIADNYLRAIGVAAVYVMADPWGSSRSGASQHLERTVDAWKQQHFELKWVGWVAKLEWADWLGAAPQKFRQGNGMIRALTWEQVVLLIEAAATISDPSTSETHLYAINDHETTIKNAAEMALKARANMDELKRKGALKIFNTAYKQYNQACRARRQPAIHSMKFEDELFNTVCAIVARQADPLRETILADMRRKFPWLSSVKG